MLIQLGDRILDTDHIADARKHASPRAQADGSVRAVGHLIVTTTQGEEITLFQNETPAYALVEKFLTDAIAAPAPG